MQFSYFDKREVLQQEHFQPPILPSPHFRWVVNMFNTNLISLLDIITRLLQQEEKYNPLHFPSELGWGVGVLI